MRLPKFFQIPDTFDPDDRRRRQILNIILLFFIAAGLFSVLVTFSYGDPLMEILRDPDGLLVLLSSTSVVVVFMLLLALNRWERGFVGRMVIRHLLDCNYICFRHTK